MTMAVIMIVIILMIMMKMMVIQSLRKMILWANPDALIVLTTVGTKAGRCFMCAFMRIY